MPCSAHNLRALSKTAQLRLWRVARGTDELQLQYLESSVLAFGAWSPTRRGVGAAGSWVSHFVWNVQYVVLNPQERLLRRRSGGATVSRVVSGIRCHRSGLLWRLYRQLSRFHNVRVSACTERPYSGLELLQQRHHA